MKLHKALIIGMLTFSSLILLKSSADLKIAYFITTVNLATSIFLLWNKSWVRSR